ncbi:MAG: hypothetical protein JNK82_12520 [Myxococcaceae bacterium]|nr:hypothetical protein [Myxococcaceae bacterium]
MKRALLALFVAACGRTPSIEAPVQPLQPLEPTTPVEQPTKPIEPPKKPQAGCTGKTVVVLDGASFKLLNAAGTKTLFTFGQGQGSEEVGVMQWDLKGGLIAGMAYVDGGRELVLLKPDGTVLFNQRFTSPGSPDFHMGEDGSLALSGATGMLVRPDGTTRDLGAWLPMAPALPSGEVIVAKGRSWEAGVEKGVWQAGVVRPLAVALPQYVDLQVSGRHGIFVEGSTLVSVLDGRRITLPGPNFAIAQQPTGNFVLLLDDSAAVIADLVAGTARPVASMPKPNRRYHWWDATLQTDGAVFASAASGEENLQLKRSADLGATWADFGEPMMLGTDFGLGQWLHAVQRGGSVLALSMSTGYGHFLHEIQLITPAGAHRLATKSIYVNVDMSPGAVDLADDGQCAATWVSTDDHFLGAADLVFLDAAGQTQVITSAASEPGWLRFVP